MKTFPKRDREIYNKYIEMTEEKHLDKQYVNGLLQQEYELSYSSITRIVKLEGLKIAAEKLEQYEASK